MSTRAIRALRDGGGKSTLIPSTAAVSEQDEDDDDDSNDDEEINNTQQRRTTAAFTMLNVDNDDSEDEDEEEEDFDRKEDINNEEQVRPTTTTSNSKILDTKQSGKLKRDDDDDDELMATNEEDLDALLTEFQEQDLTGDSEGNGQSNTDETASPYDCVVSNIDIRDFDYYYTMRTSILQYNSADNSNNTKEQQQQQLSSVTRNKAINTLFGPPMDGWIRPARYVGGGMGMFPYDDPIVINKSSRTSTTTSDGVAVPQLPWPYDTNNDVDISNVNNLTTTASQVSTKRWYTFQRSETANRDMHDYMTIQQGHGDVNMLLLFVAHHPYVPEALLQLSTVLYQTNHTAEGYAMLRRCLYVYESAFHINFIHRVIVQERTYLMEMQYRNENRTFFLALFRYIQVCHVAGLNRTALATCRLLLSFDPLRDPMNVLLTIDYHTSMVGRGYGHVDQIKLLNWLIRLVDDNIIPILYQDKNIASDRTSYCGRLLDLPNWSYSYALALFDLHKAMQFVESDLERSEEIKMKADIAIQSAMSRYPSIVGYLLHTLEVDTTGRSFQRDWLTILDHTAAKARELVRHWYSTATDTIVLSATIKACDLISKIFAEQNAKLYSDDDVLQWLYDNLVVLKESESTQMPVPPCPAIMRYANVDPADYSTKVQTLPPDANIIDNSLLAHAMTIDPRRPRYIRQRNQRGGDEREDDILYDELGNPFLPQQLGSTSYFGPPTEAIDPDWPMAEVFLRSILPWNYVDGLPPPRR